MSAFIVDKAHIDALVLAGLRMGRGWRGELSWKGGWLNADTAGCVGLMLWRENVKSVRHRYPDAGDLEEPFGVGDACVDGYTFNEATARTLAPVAVLKALACYEYQACEHDGWEASQARAFCEALRSCVISELPGYEEAEWAVV